ncbi:unnamed protein product [Rhodiola kirilowii]
MAAIAGVTNLTRVLSTTTTTTSPDSSRSSNKLFRVNYPWTKKLTQIGNRISYVKPVAASGPDAISDKVAESIKEAEEACAGDPVSGECVAAWDTVEELSAAASHAREKNKNSDPLETYCKDNPETDECRTYDN